MFSSKIYILINIVCVFAVRKFYCAVRRLCDVTYLSFTRWKCTSKWSLRLFVKLVKLFYFQGHNVFNNNKEAQKIQGKYWELKWNFSVLLKNLFKHQWSVSSAFRRICFKKDKKIFIIISNQDVHITILRLITFKCTHTYVYILFFNFWFLVFYI